MLVLSRKKHQKIMMVVPASDKPTTIYVMPTDKRCSIGIKAPMEVSISRPDSESNKETAQRLAEEVKTLGT